MANCGPAACGQETGKADAAIGGWRAFWSRSAVASAATMLEGRLMITAITLVRLPGLRPVTGALSTLAHIERRRGDRVTRHALRLRVGGNSDAPLRDENPRFGAAGSNSGFHEQ